MVGEGLGEAMRTLMIFAIIGVLSILGGIGYVLFKLIV